MRMCPAQEQPSPCRLDAADSLLHPPDMRIQPCNGCNTANTLIALQPECPDGDHRRISQPWLIYGVLLGRPWIPGAENVRFSCLSPALLAPSARFPSLVQLFFLP